HGVIMSEHEVETGPGLTVIAARMPGVALHPFVLANEMWNEALDDALAFARAAPGVADAELVMLFGDPFTLDIERVLGAFNRHAPGLRVIGGMASAGGRPGSNALLLNDWMAPEGGVGLAFKGALRADVIVSQGCRPVGPPLEVTKADGNVVIELDGQPALERAEQVLRGLSPVERERLSRGLYIGRPARRGAEGRGGQRGGRGADRGCGGAVGRGRGGEGGGGAGGGGASGEGGAGEGTAVDRGTAGIALGGPGAPPAARLGPGARGPARPVPASR